MAEFVNSVILLGDDAVTDSIINRSITEYFDDTIKIIGNNAFDSCTALTTVNCPAATSIDNSAFGSCTALTTVSFPTVTSIGNSAFTGCSALVSVDFPKAQNIGQRAFQSDTSIAAVNLPAATKIDQFAFAYSTAIATVDIAAVTTIETQAFNGCGALKAFILRNTAAVSTLKLQYALSGTPIASGTGYIYVPSALIEGYKGANQWSTYANQFRALEDYTVDGTTTGELDPSKI